MSGHEGIVLDFFAGSASTADAVAQANIEGGSQWRYVLVQLPEPVNDQQFFTIAEIAKERIRRAYTGLQGKLQSYSAVQEAVAPDLGFKVFKLASSNIKPRAADFDTMEQDLLVAVDNIKSDRSEDDVLYERLLKYGLDLAIPTETRAIEDRTVTVIDRRGRVDRLLGQ